MKNTNFTRRALSLALALVLAVSGFAFTAFAAGDAALTVSAGSAKPGETIEVKISISNNPGVAGVDFELKFDKELVTPKAFVNGSAGFNGLSNVSSGSGLDMTTLDAVTGVFYRETNVNADTILCTYVFTVSEDAAGKDLVFEIAAAEATDYLGEDVQLAKGDVTVKIAADDSEDVTEDDKKEDDKKEETSVIPEGGYELNPKAINKPFMAGYSDGTFKPNQFATRYEVVEALYNIYDFSDVRVDSTKTFKDVSAKYKQMVAVLVSAGVISGMGDGTFGGDKPITRVQFCVLLSKLEGLKLKAQAGQFKDVQTSYWGAPYITPCANAGLVVGDEKGYFNADANITRAQVATILKRLVGAADGVASVYTDLEPGAWYVPYVAAVAG